MKKQRNKKAIIIILMLSIALCIYGISRAVAGKGTTVVIDAGHGGKDVGAVLGERYEKDDNLKLALEVKKELKKKDVKVVMTRNDDEFVSLEDRCKIANKKKADLFVALHRNSAESGSGVEIWIKSNASKKEQRLADNILNAVDDVGVSQSRGVKKGYIGNPKGDYFVNKNTNMPSCLVEMGFITNDTDNELFDKNISEYAKAIANAIYESL